MSNLEKRLLAAEDKQQLTEYVRTLTIDTDLAENASKCGEELCVTRVLAQRNFWDACSSIVSLEVDQLTMINQAKTSLNDQEC